MASLQAGDAGGLPARYPGVPPHQGGLPMSRAQLLLEQAVVVKEEVAAEVVAEFECELYLDPEITAAEIEAVFNRNF